MADNGVPKDGNLMFHQKLYRWITRKINTIAPRMYMLREAQVAFWLWFLRAYFTGRAFWFWRVSTEAQMMWMINPIARMGSIILIIGFVAMKWAPWLNKAPLLSKINNKFSARWTQRNEIRKSPDKLMMTFFPIEEVKKLLIICFIY